MKPYLVRQLTLDPVPLPFSPAALAPTLSARAVQMHYDQYVRYCKKARSLAIEAGWRGDERLEDLVRSDAKMQGSSSPLFEQAAQAWNHAFLWLSFDPRQSTHGSEFAAELCRRFEGEIAEAAAASFGSGWVWLVQCGDRGRVNVRTTKEAWTPIAGDPDAVPLLVVDVWEHAYFLDYGFDRKKYAMDVVGLLDWNFAALRAIRLDDE